MSLLAVDIGSSRCKAIVFATEGEILAQHSVGYCPEFPRPCFAEMDPARFWNAVCTCCRTVSRNLSDPVQALALSSHGETFVPVDSHGEPLTHAILNQDSRALQESIKWEEVWGRQRIFQITGLFSHPMYPIPKILWLRKHRPEVFAATRCFVSLVGHLLQRMNLPAYVDYSLASRFLAFDIRRHSWSDEILGAAALTRDCLPTPVPAGTIAGRLEAESANQLGVPAGTPVVLGGHDQPCGALGAGVIAEGRIFDSMGTYECLVAASDAPVLNDSALQASLNSYCHVVPDKFVTLAYFPSGIMVQWFHDLLFAGGSAQSEASREDLESSHYSSLEAHVPETPTDLCITPHLIGTGSPDFNPRIRGLIAGLTPATDRCQIYKGILEGVGCELAMVSEALAEAVGKFDDIYVTGGGTRSALGLRLRAALTGRRLHVMQQQEAVCLGTAILAGVAIGEYASIAEAVAALVKESAIVAPDARLAASYRDQVSRYRHLRSTALQQAGNIFARQEEKD